MSREEQLKTEGQPVLKPEKGGAEGVKAASCKGAGRPGEETAGDRSARAERLKRRYGRAVSPKGGPGPMGPGRHGPGGPGRQRAMAKGTPKNSRATVKRLSRWTQ